MKRSELRMPPTGGRPDNLGIRYEGPVLNGETSVEFYQRKVAELASMSTNGALAEDRPYTDSDPRYWRRAQWGSKGRPLPTPPPGKGK